MADVIQGLWIGSELSPIEKLSIASFLANGHQYHLYTYGDVKGIPKGAIKKDGNSILPEKNIFVNKQGSYSPFSNWFRWEMLHRNGGYYCDTDIVCLRTFDFEEDMIFGEQSVDYVNTAVLKFASSHELTRFMRDMCVNPNNFCPHDTIKVKIRKTIRKHLLGNRRGNLFWGEHGPSGTTAALKYFGLYELRKPYTYFYPIKFQDWKSALNDDLKDDLGLYSNSYAIHLWNELMRRDKSFDKNSGYTKNSLVQKLIDKYRDYME